jgi:hypothetical protein
MIQRAVLCLVNGQQIDQKMMQEPSQLLGKGIEGRGL